MQNRIVRIALPELDVGTFARSDALASLENICRVLILRDLTP